MSNLPEGNSQEKLPESTLPAEHHIMAPLADGFGPMITTTDVVGGMGNVKPVALTAIDGSSVMAEHHLIGLMPVTPPTQDVPEGESKAKP